MAMLAVLLYETGTSNERPWGQLGEKPECDLILSSRRAGGQLGGEALAADKGKRLQCLHLLGGGGKAAASLRCAQHWRLLGARNGRNSAGSTASTL